LQPANTVSPQTATERMRTSIYLDRDKPRQGAAANTLELFRNGAVGFIEWLDVITHFVPG